MKNFNILQVSILFFAFLGFFFMEVSCHRDEVEVAPNISILDSLMQHEKEFTLEQLTRIAEIKQKLQKAKSTEQKYFFNDLLFNSFYTLNADSALFYADKALKYAKKTGNRRWITSSIINKSSVLAATGLLKAALEEMEKINRDSLSREELVDYYGQMIYLYSHLGNYTGKPDNNYYITERLYKDSIMQVVPRDNPQYLWYKAWDILGTKQNSDSVILALKEIVDSSNLNLRQDAKNAYVLARLYQDKGDMANFENYMALAAIVDVKIANSEIASIEDLARYRFSDGKGDIDRAYKYVHYSLNKALEYPDRTRALGITMTLSQISEAYQQKIERQKHTTILFLVLVCVLVVVLSCAIIAFVVQNKRLHQQGLKTDAANHQLNKKVEELSEADEKLNSMNTLLKDLNEDLKTKNEQLYEANFVKEEYIGYVFSLCSSYLTQISDIKRNIYLKIIKKQYKEIEAETSDIDMKEDLKEFYHSFDMIFLNLYPNFVSDFNSLLKEDKQITLKEGELLNMELRIYALVRLGINDSVKIADFLHCAPQTVYNYRLRARSRTTYEKSEFLEKVKSMGNFLGKKV
ncbi:MAG: transcriptional regulator [Muribaculaceae bacterium]|nr:transcriptional regulator [Muribaculaceae bacterium]